MRIPDKTASPTAAAAAGRHHPIRRADGDAADGDAADGDAAGGGPAGGGPADGDAADTGAADTGAAGNGSVAAATAGSVDDRPLGAPAAVSRTAGGATGGGLTRAWGSGAPQEGQ
jgi:acetyl-CoA/propionyl-CoA carboxylase biotin carboxyl carrier protein